MRLLLYAPNVHTGGGFVLLQALLRAWPSNKPLFAWLDIRAQDRLQLPRESQIKWVMPSVTSRLRAEFSLAATGTSQDRVLCFHGLPPLLVNRASLFVFLQNRILLGQVSLTPFGWKTSLRLRIEQVISRLFRHRIATYWVQTSSMANSLQKWHGSEHAHVRILPFSLPVEPQTRAETLEWDFVYVADGEAHKNHRKLVEAWVLLAQQGIKPTLALTLSLRDSQLANWVNTQANAHDLRIINLGPLPHSQVFDLYSCARALVFPSQSESFGLPLIEARDLKLPILAGELDFVRDVCEPVETFDPSSHVSIARAVRRFLGKAEVPCKVLSASEFLSAVMCAVTPIG